MAQEAGIHAANLVPGLCPSQMTEQHGYELAPTTEPAGVALGPVLNDGPLKLGAGKQRQHLLKMLDTRIMAALVLPMVHVSQRKP
jgi:hypothetical protein